jgi:hypothetical protein
METIPVGKQEIISNSNVSFYNIIFNYLFRNQIKKKKKKRK